MPTQTGQNFGRQKRDKGCRSSGRVLVCMCCLGQGRGHTSNAVRSPAATFRCRCLVSALETTRRRAHRMRRHTLRSCTTREAHRPVPGHQHRCPARPERVGPAGPAAVPARSAQRVQLRGVRVPGAGPAGAGRHGTDAGDPDPGRAVPDHRRVLRGPRGQRRSAPRSSCRRARRSTTSILR